MGQSESAIVDRHGPPEYDSRVTPYRRYHPTDERERVELGLDDENHYTLTWITGILGQNHVKVRFTDGVATRVERGSHR